MDCHIKTKKEKILRRKIAKSSLKNRLFKFRSHPHGDFGIWHLLYSHYKKWVQKIPEALRHLGFLLWHLFRMHNMVADVGLMCPLENIVVSGMYTVVPTRYSLFSPLSHSLFRPPGAVALQAHDLRAIRSYIDVALVIDVLDRTGVTIAKPPVSP